MVCKDNSDYVDCNANIVFFSKKNILLSFLTIAM